MSKIMVREAARDVVAYWDNLNAIPVDDPRPVEQLAFTMDYLIDMLREALER